MALRSREYRFTKHRHEVPARLSYLGAVITSERIRPPTTRRDMKRPLLELCDIRIRCLTKHALVAKISGVVDRQLHKKFQGMQGLVYLG
ncbi:hypothetical protein VCV18_003904 [Metarhizium anisopliae]